MQHAKKLILIEPHLLEHREYKEMQKPADKKTKSKLSLEMQKILEDDEMSDDLKAKKYQQILTKYLHLSNVVPLSTHVDINPLTPEHVRRTRRRRKTRRTSWEQY